MSKLDDLIKELCPDGVNYHRVDEVCDITRGRVMSKDYINENSGDYPVYSSQTENDGCLGNIATYDFDGEYLTWTTDGANAGSVFYRNGKFSVTNVCGLLKVKVDYLITKYLYYALSIEAPKYVNKGMGNPKLMSNVMARVKIPLPDLLIQREIVHILDSFTLLTAELTAELTARRQQYEFYRDYLLNFEADSYSLADDIEKVNVSNVEYKKIGDIATDIYRGAGIKRTEVTEEGTPCVRYGEIYTTYNVTFDKCVSHTNPDFVPNKKWFEHGDILFAITGESVEEIAKSCAYMGNDKCLAGGDIVVLKHKQNPKYLAYALSTTNAQMQKSKGKVKSKVVHSSVPAICDIVIPIPPLEEQERIANLIEKFDLLCNDIANGLPAEIEARKQQYEFYRDVLLSFDEERRSQLVKVERERELTRSKALKWLKLGEIATITRGGNFQKKDFTETGKPCIHYGQIYTRYGISATETLTFINEDNFNKSKKAVKGDIVMAVTSENVEDVCKCVTWLGEDDIAVSGHTAIIHSSINSKYLAYYFHTSMFFQQKRKLAHGTKVIEVTPDKLNDIVIPVPPLEEQERIVSILDRFDKLCNDISEGIPAEIEARQKQYEYYRDKLLSFSEKKS